MENKASKCVTPFSDMTSEELVEIYHEYEDWNDTGIIKDGTNLASMRDKYLNEYGGSAALRILELHLLKECAKRFSAFFNYDV